MSRTYHVVGMSRMLLTARLNVAFERAGLTQAELAAKLGITQSAVGLWLSGKTVPRLEMLERAVAAMGFTMLEFYAANIEPGSAPGDDSGDGEEAA